MYAYIINMDDKIGFVFCNQKFYITANEDIVTVFNANGTMRMKDSINKIEKDSHDLFMQLITAVYYAF